jgi:hypothetical protein
MAFSISMIGKPIALLAELQKRADALQATPGSEQDFDDLSRVLNPVFEIIKSNVDSTKGWVMQVDIQGSSTVDPSTKARTYGRCNVNVRSLGVLVE